MNVAEKIAIVAMMSAALVSSSRLATSAATKPAPTSVVPADIRTIMNKPAYAKAVWGLRVMDGNRVLIDLNSHKQLYIGSVRKTFTLTELLAAVGASHRYDTPVYRQGRVIGGVLHGRLILVASGDLTMGGRTNPDGSVAYSAWDHNEADSLGNAILTKPNPLAGYLALARAVRSAGIDRVAGEVVVDDRLFKPFLFRDQFDVRPIFVNDDAVDLSIAPGGNPGSPVRVSSRPISAALTIADELRTGPPGSQNTLKIDPELPQCIGMPRCSATVRGRLPSDYVPPLTGKRVLVQTVRIVRPSNYARTIFIEALEAAGVKVDAPAVEPNPSALLPPKDSYRRSDRVAVLTGLPESENAKFVLKVSYNIGADTSLVLFGVANHRNSMPAALQFEREYLASRYGIPPNAYHFVDGSGGGETTATNTAVTQLLEASARAPAHAAFLDALPVLGVDGSLASVDAYKKDPTLAGATGQVRAKTGTFVTAVASKPVLKGQAFAGYITTKHGRHLTYEIVVNNVPIAGIPDVIEVFQDEGTISAMLWRDY